MKNLITSFLSLLLTMGLFAAGCGDDSDTDDNDADGGGDTDTDTDTDTDVDAGSECDPATDTCCDVDGNSCTACTDGVRCDMEDCTGGKYDPNSGLCWQDPPSASVVRWYVAAGIFHDTINPDTQDYCGDLGSGWRLPTISELRSLFRSGTDAECHTLEWNLAWTSVPSGYCGVWDSCLNGATCHSSAECVPSACDMGPGAEGCYWDAALSGTCDGHYWSSSEREEDPTYLWVVTFDSPSPYVGIISKGDDDNVRCVRSGP